MHRVYLQFESASGGLPAGAVAPDQTLWITGEEAEHAVKVKRIAPGERLEVLDGRGTVLRGRVERAGPDLDRARSEAGGGGEGGGTRRKGRREWALEVRIEAVAPIARVRPRVEVWSATPKGGRVDELIDGLSQVGAAAWVPLATERGVVSPRESKLDRLERVAWEAAKQCGRAWALEIGEEASLSRALEREDGVAVVIADAAGMPYQPTGAAAVRLLVGPEGGWSGAELTLARELGAVPARFGPHVMRIETAAVVAAGVVLDQEGRAADAESDENEG